MGSERDAPRRDGDAMPAVDEAVAAILTVRDYLTASGATTEALRAFVGIVATWKRDRDERDALAKRAEAAEAERDRWKDAAERSIQSGEQLLRVLAARPAPGA